ncbi:HIT domain-containing protein [Candidatus Saccharibacteria bacterium]|nr:HIT domain-containing protein [Candidatus Saccharibacteria bacterium]
MSSVFSKIVAGEIPCYKIYEDDVCLAFLDINPEAKGHTLVIPKIEVDKIYDLDDATYTHLFMVAKKLMKHMEEKLGARTIMKVIGVDVPHAHIHLIPFDPNNDGDKTLELTSEEFETIRQTLAL